LVNDEQLNTVKKLLEDGAYEAAQAYIEHLKKKANQPPPAVTPQPSTGVEAEIQS